MSNPFITCKLHSRLDVCRNNHILMSLCGLSISFRLSLLEKTCFYFEEWQIKHSITTVEYAEIIADKNEVQIVQMKIFFENNFLNDIFIVLQYKDLCTKI